MELEDTDLEITFVAKLFAAPFAGLTFGVTTMSLLSIMILLLHSLELENGIDSEPNGTGPSLKHVSFSHSLKTQKVFQVQENYRCLQMTPFKKWHYSFHVVKSVSLMA